MRSALALSTVTAVAMAASDVPTYESSLNMTIANPGAVDPQIRGNLLCNNDVNEIGCDPQTLVYDCTCTANNSAPALQYYVNSMPTHICEYLYGECIDTHTTREAQDDCQTNIQDLCGKLDAADAVVDSTSTTAADTTTTASKGSKATGTDAGATTATGDSASSTSTGLAAPTLVPGAQGVGAAALAAIGALAYLV